MSAVATIHKRRLAANRRTAIKAKLIQAQSVTMHRYVAALYRGLLREILSGLGIRKDDDDLKLPPRGAFDAEKFRRELENGTLRIMATVYRRNLSTKKLNGSPVGSVSVDMGEFGGRGVGNLSVTANQEDALTAAYIRRMQPRFANMADKDARYIQDLLAKTVEQGVSPAEFAERVTERFDGLTQYRAGTIARNESATAYSEARSDFWDEVLPGTAKQKEWLPSIGGEYDRTWHNLIPAAGPVPFDGQFTIIGPNGVFAARYPNDPFLPPAESINCQCDYRILFE